MSRSLKLAIDINLQYNYGVQDIRHISCKLLLKMNQLFRNNFHCLSLIMQPLFATSLGTL